jgi:hypothetical protein
MPPFRIRDDVIVADLEASGAIGPKVVTVRADGHCEIGAIRTTAARVARSARRLAGVGYDLRHIMVEAICVRSDDFEE